MTSAIHAVHLDMGRRMRGGQWQVFQLMEELRRLGVSQTLLAPGGSPLLEKVEEAGFEAGPISLGALWRQTRRASLIHAHDARSHSMGALFHSRLPLVVARRVAFPVRVSPVSRWKYARVSLYIAVSRNVKGHLIAAGVPEQKIVVVPDGVRFPEFANAGASAVLALDSHDPGKCGVLLREAAAAARVDILFSSDLNRDLPAASVFVYLSESEGLGSAALLAMAHGVPVVASRVGGLPEAVEDGVTGLLTANDAASVAACLRRLLDDEPFRLRLGAQARERVRQRFTIQKTAADTLLAYRKVLA
ncbi:MAG TPA: glycosyltransferase family 4 protein [Bryobacteraceae bacterium]|jgi:glycosyltransferase involved in cell wall biosynthesis|nr:glycosyltransferase family 4 protein [Bryobacteraceae bacterium]